jgi:pyrroline-5-carboxylate reductase
MLTQTIGFIGAGQMARALARGFVAAGLVGGEKIVAFDPVAAAASGFCGEVPGATIAKNNAEVASRSQVIFLAVKPQSMTAAMNELADDVGPDKLFVSIAAGITLAKLSVGLKTQRVIRVMPNTPVLVGQGASAFALGTGATAEDGQLVGKLLSAVGKAFAVDEKLLDAVTGLSGSGPAFVYVMIEALSDGGVRMGLPRDVASALAAQTVLGSAQMVLTTGEHPAALKDKVASPGGTTIAGLAALENHGLRAALIAAVEAATKRSQELGK